MPREGLVRENAGRVCVTLPKVTPPQGEYDGWEWRLEREDAMRLRDELDRVLAAPGEPAAGLTTAEWDAVRVRDGIVGAVEMLPGRPGWMYGIGGDSRYRLYALDGRLVAATETATAMFEVADA